MGGSAGSVVDRLPGKAGGCAVGGVAVVVVGVAVAFPAGEAGAPPPVPPRPNCTVPLLPETLVMESDKVSPKQLVTRMGIGKLDCQGPLVL